MFKKSEVIQKLLVTHIQIFFCHTTASQSLSPENVETLFVQIVNRNTIHRNCIPFISGFRQ